MEIPTQTHTFKRWTYLKEGSHHYYHHVVSRLRWREILGRRTTMSSQCHHHHNCEAHTHRERERERNQCEGCQWVVTRKEIKRKQRKKFCLGSGGRGFCHWLTWPAETAVGSKWPCTRSPCGRPVSAECYPFLCPKYICTHPIRCQKNTQRHALVSGLDVYECVWESRAMLKERKKKQLLQHLLQILLLREIH